LASTAPVILALRTVRDLDRINAPSALARPRREAPWARVESTTEAEGAWSIEGTAADGSAVFLFAAEKFVAAAPVSGGRFRFEGVRSQGLSGQAIPLSSSASVLPAPEPVPAAAASALAVPEASRPDPQPPAPESPALAAPLRPRPPSGAPGSTGLFPGAPDLTRGPSDRREILVSFDGGSSDHGATDILDALSSGIRTHFLDG
jgi:hypothetical protein